MPLTVDDVVYASPRKLPLAQELTGRVVVLDIAFAADGSGGVSFETVTKRFLDDLGERLAAWVDHHDHPAHPRYAGDPRFVLTTKAQAGACPEMIDAALVARAGPVDTILTHLDLDGLYAAAKWMLGGREPYPGADVDANCVDTRRGTPSAVGEAIDQALRARYRDDDLRRAVIRYLTRETPEDWTVICSAQEAFAEMLRHTQELAAKYEKIGRVALVKLPRGASRRIDKTTLLLLGQEMADVAVVQHSGMITAAAPFDSGFDLPRLLQVDGGMPTRCSAPASRLGNLLAAVNDGRDP